MKSILHTLKFKIYVVFTRSI